MSDTISLKRVNVALEAVKNLDRVQGVSVLLMAILVHTGLHDGELRHSFDFDLLLLKQMKRTVKMSVTEGPAFETTAGEFKPEGAKTDEKQDQVGRSPA